MVPFILQTLQNWFVFLFLSNFLHIVNSPAMISIIFCPISYILYCIFSKNNFLFSFFFVSAELLAYCLLVQWFVFISFGLLAYSLFSINDCLFFCFSVWFLPYCFLTINACLIILHIAYSLPLVGLHTGTRVPIGTDTHFEKKRYLPVSLRTGTKWHRFVFEYRFVSTD